MKTVFDHEALAQEAVRLVTPSIEALFAGRAKRDHLCIVVLDPGFKPGNSANGVVLGTFRFGEKGEWENSYDLIARAKAEAAWKSGRSDEALEYADPTIIVEGDTPFNGAANYRGVIVGSSGIQSYFDAMISMWVAVTFYRLCQDEVEKWKTANPGKGII